MYKALGCQTQEGHAAMQSEWKRPQLPALQSNKLPAKEPAPSKYFVYRGGSISEIMIVVF